MTKHLIILFIFTFCTLQLMGNNTIPKNNESHTIIHEEINFELSDSFSKGLLKDVYYYSNENYLKIESLSEMISVQLLNETGNIELQLPIKSYKLVLSLNDYLPGKYEVNLLFEDGSTLESAELILKN